MTIRRNECLCELDDQCHENIGMYSNGNRRTYQLEFYIPNLFVGCFAIQSVLQSTLECFFNQTCLDAVQLEISSPDSVNMSILEENNTRFSPETPIGIMMDALMIEEWGQTIRYEQYYHQCAPKLCTYTTSYRKNSLYIFTRLISLIGGLTIVLKIVVYSIVRRIRKYTRPANPSRGRIQNSIDRLKWVFFCFVN